MNTLKSGQGGRARGVRRAGMLGLAVAASLLAAGCAVEVGGGPSRRPTLGQELMDLKHALDSGAMTEAEYEQAKAELIRSRR